MPLAAMRLAREPAFRLLHRPARGPGALPCWIALPDEPLPDAPPLVAVHGIARGAQEQAETFGAEACAAGRIVVAPLFDEASWTGYQRALAPKRADLALLGLLDGLADAGLIPPGPFDLAGYSGGAQFAHRFALLYPHRLRRLSVCAAGWWTMPGDAPFPYGLGGRRGAVLAAGLDRFLGLDIRVSVGADDDRPDAATRSTPDLDAAQGPDRVSRARAWVAALRVEAARRGHDTDRLSLAMLPGSGHDFRACAAAGLARLTLDDHPAILCNA